MIQRFEGRYRFLSNFFPAEIEFDERLWPTTEHTYQAQKTRDFEAQERIREASSPGKAKGLGRGVELRDDWEQIKVEVMKDILICKFEQHPGLAKRLAETHPEKLVEGNDWGDDFWGVTQNGQGTGQNWLGRILMAIRNDIIEGP